MGGDQRGEDTQACVVFRADGVGIGGVDVGGVSCTVGIAYAIGVADPVSINVETFGTEQGVTRGQIAAAVRKVFDLRPAAIIDELDRSAGGPPRRR